MTTSIVGVHGIWNYGPGTPSIRADALSARWTQAVRTGFARPPALDVHVAYYAHLLKTPTRQGSDDLSDLDPEAIDRLLAWAALFDPPTEVAQGRGMEPARRAFEWIADRFGLDHAFVRTLVGRFLTEVDTYLADPNTPARAVARDLVIQEIRTREFVNLTRPHRDGLKWPHVVAVGVFMRGLGGRGCGRVGRTWCRSR